MPLPQVAIIGRMNTGKSTLFNRLTESRRAIMSNVPGTTRDRSILPVTWQGVTFELIDTGGVDIDEIKSFKLLSKKTLPKDITSVEKQVIKQTQTAIRQAHLILLVVDGQVGVTPSDREIVRILRQVEKPVLLVCNKIDSQKYEAGIEEFLKLGMGQPQAVSAANGVRTGDLLDLIVKNLKKIKVKKGRAKKAAERHISVSLIGKPNVGKSSLLNALAGEERVIVSPQPQTTREPQDITLEYKDTKITIIDTAGIKRKAKVLAGIDSVATSKAIESMRASDIVLFMLDANEPITSQDKSLAGLVDQSFAGAIIVINKWDKVEKTATLNAHFKDLVEYELPPLKWAPLIFISAKTGQSVQRLFDMILDIAERRHLQLTTVELYDFLKKLIEKKHPVGGSGIEKPRIKRLEQTKTNPPEFVIRLGHDQRLDESYVRFIENSLRKKYHLEGVNIKVYVDNA